MQPMATKTPAGALPIPAPAGRDANGIEWPNARGGSSREASGPRASPSALASVKAALVGGVRGALSAVRLFLGIVLVAYAFPVAILAIGIPFALLVSVVAWAVAAVLF